MGKNDKNATEVAKPNAHGWQARITFVLVLITAVIAFLWDYWALIPGVLAVVSGMLSLWLWKENHGFNRFEEGYQQGLDDALGLDDQE